MSKFKRLNKMKTFEVHLIVEDNPYMAGKLSVPEEILNDDQIFLDFLCENYYLAETFDLEVDLVRDNSFSVWDNYECSDDDGSLFRMKEVLRFVLITCS